MSDLIRETLEQEWKEFSAAIPELRRISYAELVLEAKNVSQSKKDMEAATDSLLADVDRIEQMCSGGRGLPADLLKHREAGRDPFAAWWKDFREKTGVSYRLDEIKAMLREYRRAKSVAGDQPRTGSVLRSTDPFDDWWLRFDREYDLGISLDLIHEKLKNYRPPN